MRPIASASAVLLALALAWNGLVHLVLLRRANEAIRHLRRTDLPGTLWLSLLLTAAVCVLFVYGYTRVVRTHTLREGLGYGLLTGLFAALIVDVNQYLLYPLPLGLVLCWFISGVLEFTFYGAVLSFFFRSARAIPEHAAFTSLSKP